jgi:hypothetical protein
MYPIFKILSMRIIGTTLITGQPYTEQIKNQVNIFTENFVRACEIWNQIALNSIDISKENIKNVYPSIDINGILPSTTIKNYDNMRYLALETTIIT